MCNQLCNVLLALVLVIAGLNNPSAQTYGSGSRCVEHSGTWQARQGGNTRFTLFQQSGCYQVMYGFTVIIKFLSNIVHMF